MNDLFFGDNLDVLRARLVDGCVDLVYLDPPFNSQAQFNVFFKTKAEDQASAQATAFRDMWTWLDGAEAAYKDIMMRGGPTARFVKSLRDALGDSDTMAYLVMMASRLHELQRVMKPTATLYLHCDPTASHYLKVICDGIFQEGQFLSESFGKERARTTQPVDMLRYTTSFSSMPTAIGIHGTSNISPTNRHTSMPSIRISTTMAGNGAGLISQGQGHATA